MSYKIGHITDDLSEVQNQLGHGNIEAAQELLQEARQELKKFNQDADAAGSKGKDKLQADLYRTWATLLRQGNDDDRRFVIRELERIAKTHD